jgi:hypothetical protein
VYPQCEPPREITPELLEFCRELDPSREPAWVSVMTLPGASAAQEFAALKNHITQSGGKVQFGWILREVPDWYMEAEFHGVWVKPGGEMIAVLPRPEGVDRHLFLPDSRRTFQGQSIPSRFRALSTSPDVRAVVRDAEFHARLLAESEDMRRRSRVAQGGAARNDACPCGSGLKYKKCCGRRS